LPGVLQVEEQLEVKKLEVRAILEIYFRAGNATDDATPTLLDPWESPDFKLEFPVAAVLSGGSSFQLGPMSQFELRLS
jgi:hypothetical protein